MITTRPTSADHKDELPFTDQVFRVRLMWPILAVAITFGGPPALWWLASQDVIPNGPTAKLWMLALYGLCFGIVAAGIYFFAITMQSVRVNQAGIHFWRMLSVKSMPWDELLAYDVSIPLNMIEVIDIRGRAVKVNCNLYEWNTVEVLSKYAAGSRRRAFEHIERRSLKCAVKSRIHLAILTLLFSAGFFFGLASMGKQYAPTLAYEIIVYNTAQAICLFAALMAIYEITSTVTVDRFSVTRRSLWFMKTQISFSQITNIDIWLRVLESDAPREIMDIKGRGDNRIRITQYARNYKLLRDYILEKAQLAKVNDRR